ncbi:MAG: SagB/ThcOx family dehydrogenase, partial [Phycisphaerae bacterium]
MRRPKTLIAMSAAIVAVALAALTAVHVLANDAPEARPLPRPKEEMSMSLQETLSKRRSIRNYSDNPVSEERIAQLCWAAQGISDRRRGFRTAPSAGALYPLELYVVTADGVSRYVPEQHAVQRHSSGDVRSRLAAAALHQSSVENAPVVFVFAGVFKRTESKYGERAERYVWMETGHAAQNLLLAATAMDLGAVPVGAFRDEQVAEVLSLPEDHRP